MPPTARTPFQQPSNKLGITPAAATNRTQASMSPLMPTADNSRSDVFSYFTKNDGQTYTIYNGDRRWVKVTLTLRTGGPVAAGTRENLGIVTSGQGILLNTNESDDFVIAKGTKLYVAASAVSRVDVKIEPIPWLEEIAALVQNVLTTLAAALRR